MRFENLTWKRQEEQETISIFKLFLFHSSLFLSFILFRVDSENFQFPLKLITIICRKKRWIKQSSCEKCWKSWGEKLFVKFLDLFWWIWPKKSNWTNVNWCPFHSKDFNWKLSLYLANDERGIALAAWKAVKIKEELRIVPKIRWKRSKIINKNWKLTSFFFLCSFSSLSCYWLFIDLSLWSENSYNCGQSSDRANYWQ